MEGKNIFSDLALIGDDLEICKNVSIKISEKGIIEEINENSEKMLKTSNNRTTFLLPGLINSHTHIADNIGKETGLNLPILDVVSGPDSVKHTLLESSSQTQKMEGIKYAINEMISNGITYFIDFRENGKQGIKLLLESVSQSPIGLKILGRTQDNDDLKEILNLTDGLGFPSCSNINTTLLKKTLSENYRVDKIIATHISEVKRENEILEVLLDDDLIDVFIHGTHFIEEDLIKIRKCNKKIVICPQSNGYFGAGVPPIKEIFEINLEASLGTDNMMAIRPDLFEEMRFLYKISKLKHPDFKIDSKSLLKMATINAAKNFGIENEKGSISVGKDADFILINISDPNYFSFRNDNIVDVIVHRTTSENIKEVIIKGNIIFERK